MSNISVTGTLGTLVRYGMNLEMNVHKVYIDSTAEQINPQKRVEACCLCVFPPKNRYWLTCNPLNLTRYVP